MWRTVGLWLTAAVAMAVWTQGSAARAESPAAPVAVLRAEKPTFVEDLAAKEIRRYVYLRTGKLLPIVTDLKTAPAGGLIFVWHPCRFGRLDFDKHSDLKQTLTSLAPEQYVLKTIVYEGRSILVVTGGGGVGQLYAAYRLAEHLGVRFYLEGDVVPDRQIALEMPQLDDTAKPRFDHRGIQPFHDFPEGPDWWNADGYKAIIGQLPKLRMNFFGLHCYPEGGVGPEPLVWIGPPDEIDPAGRDRSDYAGAVTASYPSRHFTTLNGTWGYHAMKTGDYLFGAAAMYDRDDYGIDYMQGMSPWPDTSEKQNELFGRMGGLLKEAFTFAGHVGVKTCIGTETPLSIPTPVKERLKKAGKNPDDPAVVREIYEGMFRRIIETHPLDYYWFWTPEGWTWSAVSQQQIDATLADFRAAIAAAEKVKAPFTLATCGWVLGPPQEPALFDNSLPKQMPMSCINRQVGHSPVEPGFANVKGRPKWAIPWMEDDPALSSPQLWAGRMRKDAADALAYGCMGLLGIHWRTRILGPNVSALANAAWDQTAWNPALSGQPQPPEPKLPEGPVAGLVARFPNTTFADTKDQPLYQSVRYDVSAYHLDVPNGTYSVTLKFCEPAYSQKNQRVFGVKIQGKPVIERLDIFAKVGKDRALDYTFKDIAVSDGRLSIDFVHQVEFPCIAAIVVEGPATRKINCGGDAYKDFQADWPPSTGPGGKRFLPATDFYVDWARAQFGPEVAEAAAAVFDKIDGHLPRPSDWVNGPGGINPDGRPWAEVAKLYRFVDDLEKLRPQVQGAGNLERFDYWLNNFRFMRANAQVNCTWFRFNEAMKKVKAEMDPEAQKRLAREAAQPIRKELVAQVAEVFRHLLPTVTTPGEMGTVANWQQHILPGLLIQPGHELAKILGEDLPADAMPEKDYQGPPRLFVPVVRTSLVAGERLRLTAIVLGGEPQDAVVYWRPLGGGDYIKVPLANVARGVYGVTLPAEATKADLEYYVQATVGGKPLAFPVTAPGLNQTVVVVDTK